MKRKVFIKNASLAALAPFVLGALSQCAGKPTRQRRILVLIQLVGGNDGLNTLIPLDNYAKLAEARPRLHVPENRILSLSSLGSEGSINFKT